jgi:simple sugar transport system ATP-binding protein
MAFREKGEGGMTPAQAQTAESAGGDLVARVRGVVKKYPGVLALDNVDFEIGAGEVRALLGKNGAGKSTLVRMLTGAEAPDAGEVTIMGHRLEQPGQSRTVEAGRHGVRAVYQELSQVPEMSVAENLFLGRWASRRGLLDFHEMERRAAEILVRLGIDLDPRAPIARLSPAQRQLAEVARIFLGDPKLVILDEPTSSLAAAEVDLLFKAVRALTAHGIAVIYVSHRMEEIRQIAATATIMRDGRVADMVDVASTSTREIVRLMLGHDESLDEVIEPDPSVLAADVVLRVSGVALPPKLEKIDLELRRGEVLGIAGLLGSGRTELLQIVAGLVAPTAGAVQIDGTRQSALGYGRRLRQGLGFTPESRKEDGVIPELGVDENIICTDLSKVSKMGMLSWPRIRKSAEAIIRQMNVKAHSPSARIANLSGGNQQKVVIGRWVHAGSRILLLDEPTRGVDVEAKRQIYSIIRKLAGEGKSIVFVSSEIEELPKVCDRVLVIRGGRIFAEYAAPSINAEELMAACLSAT